ncbi:MAG: hypothetical protein NC548_25970 [Lachnospiraceae bacterium]|nr:hypothetical protein [Lachnospiraceae bacterium]
MEKSVFIQKNSSELRMMLTNVGFKLDQDWSEEYLNMGTGICVTPENKFYVTVSETQPDKYETWNCFDSEDVFEIFVRYFYHQHSPKREQDKWCSYCGCEGGCNLCTNLNLLYNHLLVEYGYDER